MRKCPSILMTVTAIWLLGLGCGDKQDPVEQLEDTSDVGFDGPVTYCQHVKPVLQNRCTSCHDSTKTGTDRSGAPAAVNFDTYDLTIQSRDGANSRIQNGTMPPGSGGLPADERALFQAWIDGGTPKGESCDN